MAEDRPYPERMTTVPSKHPFAQRAVDMVRPLLKQLGLIRPRLLDFFEAGRVVGFEPGPILSALGQLDEQQRRTYETEFAASTSDLSQRLRPGEGVQSVPMALTGTESFLLYALARERRPESVVETGVANGVSTFYLLRALQQNGKGNLTSFDVNPRAGSLLRPEDQERWTFVVLPPGRLRARFAAEIARQSHIDLFIHDSDHSYSGQNFEFETVFPKMRSHSLLASDDADWSFAFLDFCHKNGLQADYLVSPMKVLGLAEKR